MESKLYIEGYQSDNGEIACPLPSSVILFITQYCQDEKLPIVFVFRKNIPRSECCTYNEKILSSLNINFASWDEIPEEVKRVSLPSLYQPDMKLVRSGLCVVLRHIIGQAHVRSPALKLVDLLGFRCGSMKMCAEVSGWTKLCEVDLPKSVTHLVKTLRDHASTNENEDFFTLPNDLVKLEGHFLKKCVIHNDDKKRRAELIRLKNYFSDPEGPYVEEPKAGQLPESKVAFSKDQHTVKLDTLSMKSDELYIEQTVTLDHGIRKYRVKKKMNQIEPEQKNEEHCKCSPENQAIYSHIADEKSSPSARSENSQTAFDLRDLQAALDTLIFTDIEYVHVYSEGFEMTVADLILFTYLYHLLEETNFDCRSLSTQLPSVMYWAGHMANLPTVLQAGFALGWQMESMKNVSDSHVSREGRQLNLEKAGRIGNQFLFKCEETNFEDEDDMELSRCAKMKHKAIKPEVIQALNKFETIGIKPVAGSHPKGDAFHVDWDNLPDGVHPKRGDVPLKRTLRKCQQLENLATAVQAIAKPDDVIVDFCSGGGHLGIVLAYLLPECQVLLVENKEESLLKSCSRLHSLGLTNVTLYQCNMDYFIGKFEIGTCLHACGSATDMVLQLCLRSRASFVICPCCYGNIHNTHLLSYPRSKYYNEANVTYKDFLTLGHAADQTEFNIALEEQGRICMSLIDTDRAHYAKELDYTVSLCSLRPLSCTPKNNLLIGSPRIKEEIEHKI